MEPAEPNLRAAAPAADPGRTERIPEAKHQTIWANPKQTQTTQWPHVPPNAMARKLTTNDQLQYFLVCQGTSFIFFYILFIFFYILLLTTAVLLVAIAARPHVNPGPHQQKGYNVSFRTLE